MADTGPKTNAETSMQSTGVKRRRTRRTALACTFCRQRKARCSGDWPSCTACTRRGRECVYAGESPATASQRLTCDLPVDDLTSHEKDLRIDKLPAAPLRKLAISYFREHYTPTLLCFLPQQQLIEDEAGDGLPHELMLCILALVSRSIPEFRAIECSSTTLSDYYAELARKELSYSYDEPSLTTVQCCLVLCVYEIGEGSEFRGWLRLGYAARQAQLLHLHKQDCDLGLMDWGTSTPSSSVTLAECQRRTFWSLFCLERLLANGRDRTATFVPEDITTQLPQSDENFIYRLHVPTATLTGAPIGPESIMASTVRIVEILTRIMLWHGRGGRHLDPRCPWLPDMPFAQLNRSLDEWKAYIPAHLQYNPRNTSAVIAMGQAKLWSLMWLVYFQARAYLHREYLPFTPKIEYDPIHGPCDGPPLVPSDATLPQDFWRTSVTVMVESANSISDLSYLMRSRGLSASAYPIPGLCLLTAASIHVIYSIFSWDSMSGIITQDSSRDYLRQDMESLNHLGQSWSLAIHWIRQVSLFYRLNSLTKSSWANSSGSTVPAVTTKELKDGVMNYVRQISPRDREARDVNLNPTFNFESWLAVLAAPVDKAVETSHENAVQATEEGCSPDVGYSNNAEYVNWMAMSYELDGWAPLPVQNRSAEWMFDDWGGWAMDD